MQTVNIKVVIFGSHKVGKTSLLNACMQKSASDDDYKPFDERSFLMSDFIFDGTLFKLELWDTRSVESYKIIEEMKNCENSVALIAYSVMEKNTLEEIKKKWIPFVRKNSPQTLIMLIGCKVDLRDDRVSLLRLDRLQNLKPISVDEGYKLAQENQAVFHECSAFSGIGISDVFYKIIKMYKTPPQDTKKCSCIIS